MARVLLIDDDPPLLDMLLLLLEGAGHVVECARDGREGLAKATSARPDIVVSDVNMPLLDGFTLCRRLREAGDTVPVLLLTSREGEIDEALGLELGADDYVVKPVSGRVLLARIDALLRRRTARERPSEARRTGALEVDADRLEVRWRGRSIPMTMTEFRLIDALSAHPGRVHSRARLLELARGDDSVVDDRLVDTYVRRLRRKLEAEDPAFDRIETVIGAGYRWRGDGGP